MLTIRWLETVDYQQALTLQYRLLDERKANRINDTILLLEHHPVITMGRRSLNEHILASDTMLKRQNIPVHRISRGGEVTYHGYGQMVGYLIFDIRKNIKKVAALMHGVESALINFLGNEFNVKARCKKAYPGVWVGDKKIGAIGVAIQSGITLHGFALNINPDLSHFSYIVACGIKAITHTSLLLEKPTLTAKQTTGAAIQARMRPYLIDMHKTL